MDSLSVHLHGLSIYANANQRIKPVVIATGLRTSKPGRFFTLSNDRQQVLLKERVKHLARLFGEGL